MDLERGKTVENSNKKNNNNNNNGDQAAITEAATTVDWRGRPSNLSKHGGMRAAVFVLGISLSKFSFFFLCFSIAYLIFK